MERARFDWLVEIGGAAGLGLAVGFAALKAAPSLAVHGASAMAAGGLASFALGLVAMRVVRPESGEHPLVDFEVEPIALDELLLDATCAEPLLLDEIFEEEALLLDDPLIEPDPAARVVRLFAALPTPTPGELKDRIDRHLAVTSRQPFAQMPTPRADATEALYAALNELKRSLR